MAKDKRFEKVYANGTLSSTEIWVDTETDVQYLFHAAGYAGGMCVLVDAEGKPLLAHKSYNGPEL